MTELKSKDVIKLVSDKEELNGFFLIDEIDSTEIKLLKPPNKTYILEIHDGIISDVDEITIVYVAPVTGIAINRNFVPGKNVLVVFKDDTEEKIGVIKSLEEDMIEVDFEDRTVFIDFGYIGLPDEIKSIMLDDGFVIEEGEDYYLPEKQQRFTLDRQLTDLMDKLLSLPNQTSKTIQNAKQIVQRFRELRFLFSTDTLAPIYKSKDYKPLIQPHQVKWIVPVTNLARTLYDNEEKSDNFILELQRIQTNSGNQLDNTYKSVYKKLLEEFTPFTLPTKYTGEQVKETTTVLIRKARVIQVKKAKDSDFFYREKEWISQVITKPYEGAFITKEEVSDFASFYILPNYAVEYTKAYCPNQYLIDKVKSMCLSPYIHPLPEGENVKTLSDCAFDVKTVLTKVSPFFSLQQCIKQLSPFLIYKNDVTIHHYNYLKTKMTSFINFYAKKQDCFDYKSNPLHEYNTQSASERQVSLLSQDNGSLYAIQKCKSFEIDYTSTLDTHINKALDTTKPVAPPIVKDYTSLTEMKEKEVTYDKQYDPTNYEELEAYDTSERMMRFLIENKKMTPQQAFIYTPYFLKNKRPVINGEYARLTVKDKISYYKRVNNEWKLDETCPGPYPCVSNEPDCDEDCVDISFRLKQNLLHTILTEYEIGSYSSEIERTKFMEEREHVLTQKEEQRSALRTRTSTKYNDAFKSLAKSMVVVDVSPNQTLLFSILQKPYDEKYKELKHFVQSKTRVAKTDENADWLYCTISNIKLLPEVFLRILDGYEKDTYSMTINKLKEEGLLKEDSANIVTLHGGFIVSSILFVQTFDDVVRATELEDPIFYELQREEHPLTPAIVEILTKISEVIRVDVSMYFNYMIRTILKNTSILVHKSIALMLKISHLVKNLEMNDKIPIMVRNDDQFKNILSKYKLKPEPLTEKSISHEITIVSSYYEIQVIAREKSKKRAVIRRTSSTLWETFLPPPIIVRVKHPTKSMEILQEIQQVVSEKIPLREGTYKVNTVAGTFLNERVNSIISHIRSKPLPMYNVNKQFIKEKSEYIYAGDIKIVELPRILQQDILEANGINYSNLLKDLKDQLNDVGIDIPEDFIPEGTSLTYMRTFIQNIANAFPKIMLTKIKYDYPISSSLIKIISNSRTHVQNLLKLMDRHYFKEIQKFSIDNLVDLLIDEDVLDMIKRLQNPVNESRIYEYEYYIYSIFLKYMHYGGARASHVLNFYITLFKQDSTKIFLSYDEIKRLTLKDRVSEANKIRLERNKMNSNDRYIFDFRQNQNIDENARLGRLRDYNARQRDVENDLFGEDLNNDNDRGGDGDRNDDGDEE